MVSACLLLLLRRSKSAETLPQRRPSAAQSQFKGGLLDRLPFKSSILSSGLSGIQADTV